MGIKGLSQFIKKKSNINKFNFDDFKDQKIAIDASIVMYSQMAICRKYICNQTDFIISDLNFNEILNFWKIKMLDFLKIFINANIHPILVFDGIACKEKDKTHKEREKQRNLRLKELEELNIELSERRKDIFQDHSHFLEKYNKKIASCVTVPKKIQNELIDYLTNLDIECMKSKTEAEKLCTSLCIENKVKAVYSADTDNLAMGCPLLLNSFKIEPNGNHVFLGYELNQILKDLDLNFDKFQDYCILCGCDFNKNIKGYGPVKCYKEIKKSENIDKLIINECLNYEFCKKIFSYENSENLIE